MSTQSPEPEYSDPYEDDLDDSDFYFSLDFEEEEDEVLKDCP